MATDRSLYVLGVDTGGTYTDAVVYDNATRSVVAKAKSPTTHDDLAVGICGAIDAVLADASVAADSIELVALSTTLATNALVEGTGRPACLITIGFGDDALDRGGLRAAVGSDHVIVVDGGHTSHGDEVRPLDLDELAERVDQVADSVDAFAITAQFATRNADHELAAQELVRARTGLPVTCSHHLSARLNGPKRGVTALLNARLIAMVEDLVSTTRSILDERAMASPIMVVRGNGSLVSADFVRDRPVETILSGPAASLIGAAHLSDTANAIISDIGGTTTDIAVLREGRPEVSDDGAVVGGHRTMVEAVMIHTHGLGGDSEVQLADRAEGCDLVVGPRRVVPLSLLAVDHEAVVLEYLDRQANSDVVGAFDGAFVLSTKRTADATLDRFETQVIDAMNADILPMSAVVTTSLQLRALTRLVGRGVLRLSAFTPTDAAQVLGFQATFDATAARLGAGLFARKRDRFGVEIAASGEEFAGCVMARLERLSAEALLAASLDRDGLSGSLATSEIVAAALDGTTQSTALVAGLAVPLVGLGAPAAIYYPKIGELLGTEVSVPEHAEVANAIGAAVGQVRVREEVVVSAPRRGVYRIHVGSEPETLWERPDAEARAIEVAATAAARSAESAGAVDVTVETEWIEKVIDVGGRPMFVEGRAVAVAAGRPSLG